MKILGGSLLAVGAMALMLPQAADAHFRLLAPESWVVENRLGNPQKAGPCGDAEDMEVSGAVTELTGGQTLEFRVQETVFHPGHYRIALAVESRDELPVDPEVTTRDSERGPWSVSAEIMDPVAPPVLVDGLWPHTEAVEGELSAQVTVPNINCDKCSFQIIQFMAEHGRNAQGDFSYHHCADVRIVADPSKPIDARWPGQE